MNRAEIIMIIIGAVTLATAWLSYFIKSLYKKGMGDQRAMDTEVKVHGYDVRKRECDAKFSDHEKQAAVTTESLIALKDSILKMNGEIMEQRRQTRECDTKLSDHDRQIAVSIESLTPIKGSIARLDASIERLDKTTTRISNDISAMKGSFDTIMGMTDRMSKKKSPLSLTEEGEMFAADNNLQAMINENWSKINSALHELKTKNPYDLQQFCIDTAFADTTSISPAQFFSEEDIDRLKIMSYTSGVPMMSITRVLGILIRDRFFSENEINVGKIDAHKQNKLKTENIT
jgi:peptidoglycan hydrolase CwlO-like protein